MRPKSIIWFEWLMLVSLALAAFELEQVWSDLSGIWPAAAAGAVIAGVFLLYVLLVLLVSRKRSQIAKWVLVGLFAVGLLGLLPLIYGGIAALGMAWSDWAGWIAQALATGLLFTPSARAWMRRRRDPTANRDTLERTFE